METWFHTQVLKQQNRIKAIHGNLGWLFPIASFSHDNQ